MVEKYAPVAPKITKLTNTSKGVSVTWGKVAGVYGYRLYRKYAGGSWTKVKDTTSTSFTDSGAKKGKKVTYTLRCIDKKARQSAVITQQAGQLQENNIISNNPDRAKSVGVVLYINVMIIWIFIESLHGSPLLFVSMLPSKRLANKVCRYIGLYKQ